MLTIEVELLHGTIRAAGADDLALTGAPSGGEWPPSPARLLAALVAGDGTRERCRMTDGTELGVLEGARPPVIHADPDGDVARSVLEERYVVLNVTTEGAVQSYPARKSGATRPGTRLCPRHPAVAYVWDDVDVSTATVAGLRARAARVGYLGCADSPVRVRVHTGPPTARIPASVWLPHPTGTTVLPMPFDGCVEVLDAAFDMFTSGQKARRAWFRVEHARYTPPETGDAPPRPRGTLLGVVFDTAVSGRRVMTVTTTLRAAVLDRYQRDVVGADADVPGVLHGHGVAPGAQHAHYLAFPDVGHRHARGRIHGAGVWLPDGTDSQVVEGVRQTLSHIRELVRPGALRVGVRPYGGEQRPRAAVPTRWLQPARRWVSAFPMVHERFVRPRPAVGDVAEWCTHAGVPAELVGMRQARVPLVPGGVSLHPTEARRQGRTPLPYSHVELSFDRPVAGPVVIGHSRQFGLGLCLPLSGSATAEQAEARDDG